MNNLVVPLGTSAKYDKAEDLCRQTLLLQGKALGREHPDTLTIMDNLAGLLEIQGKYDEAEPADAPADAAAQGEDPRRAAS